MHIQVPVLHDMAAVQLTRARVNYAFSAGRISPSEVRIFDSLLRTVADILRFTERERRRQEARKPPSATREVSGKANHYY